MCIREKQSWLHGKASCGVTQGPLLTRVYPWFNALLLLLQFLIIFEQEALHFSFALQPTCFIAGPEEEKDFMKEEKDFMKEDGEIGVFLDGAMAACCQTFPGTTLGTTFLV